jgi:putative nucleotidyltransferase with HDIG domain
MVSQSEQRFLDQLVSSLNRAMEARDPSTMGHQQRVSDLARAIAQGMDLDEQRVEAVGIAGLLHDIGKLSAPMEILCKPTHLKPFEFALISEHSEAGAKILEGVEFPWQIAIMVRQHHERLDGSGYPDGLKGGEILLESQILAVADTYDAMRSHNTYRPARPHHVVVREIQQNRGLLFDETVVDAFLTLPARTFDPQLKRA